MSQSQKGMLSAYSLKIIALLFMILDHVHSYLSVGPEWIGVTTRFVAPLFVYFLVERFHYSRNRKKYALRLITFAAIMMLGNGLINLYFNNVDPMTGTMTYYSLMQGNNIFQTLAIYLVVLILLDGFKQRSFAMKALSVILLIVLIGYSIALSEGGMFLLPMLLVFYYFYNNNFKISMGVVVWCGILFAKAFYSYITLGSGMPLIDTLIYDNQWAMVFVLIPIFLYNHTRGRNTQFSKWMFYIVYPAHLWILMIISYMFIR